MSLLRCWVRKYADALCVELRIHDETERGDNETIKMGEEKVGVATGQCCREGR